MRSDDGLYCLTCRSPLVYVGGACSGCETQTSIFGKISYLSLFTLASCGSGEDRLSVIGLFEIYK